MKTAVVILNWNGIKLLQSFIPGIVESCKNKARVVVADNASTDESLSWLKSNWPEVEIVSNPINEGFAKGYNTALQKITSEYLILLNSDVEVTPGWIDPLITWLDNHPDTAVCQPKIRWFKNRLQFEYAGACGGFIDLLGYPFCRGRIFGHVEQDNGQYDLPIPVFWATGACMAIRSEVFHKAGGFDPMFFAHMEEIDLCWRIRNMGYEIYCIPESVVYHIGGATLPKNNPGKTILNFRNNLSMLYKNLPGSKLFPVMFARFLLDGLAGIKFLLEGHPSDFIAVIRAHMQFYKRIISGKLKRDKNVLVKSHVTIYPGYIAWQHYVLRKNRYSELNFHPNNRVSS